MSEFTRQPLKHKMNRENLLRRLENMEQTGGARASMHVDSLGQMSGRTGQLLADDLIMNAGEYPATAFINWKMPTGETVALIDGFDYSPGLQSGVEIIGQAKDSSYRGDVYLIANDETGANKAILNINTDGSASIDLRSGDLTALGGQSVNIKGQTATTNDIHTGMYLDAYSSGTPAVGFGSAILHRAENSTDTLVNQGYYGFQWATATAGSEDATAIIGHMKAGALVTALTINPNSGINTQQNNVRSYTVSINDDAATSFTPAAVSGVCLVFCNADATAYNIFHYNTASPSATSFAAGGNSNTTTGALTGTTGTDTKFTVSAHTDGKLYFENRRGGVRTIFVLLV